MYTENTENYLSRSTQKHKKTGCRDKKYKNTKIQVTCIDFKN